MYICTKFKNPLNRKYINSINDLVIWHFTYSFSRLESSFLPPSSEYLAWIPNQTQLFTNYDTFCYCELFFTCLSDRGKGYFCQLNQLSRWPGYHCSMWRPIVQFESVFSVDTLRDLSRSPVMLSCQERCSSDQYQVVLLHYRYCPPFHAVNLSMQMTRIHGIV